LRFQVKGTNIRKLLKILSIKFVVIILIIITCAFLLLNHTIQTYVVRYATGKLSEQLNTTINIESAQIYFFNQVNFKNLYFEDLHGDTLLFAEKLSARYTGFNRDQRKIKLGKVTLSGAKFYLQNDSTSTINLDFIVKRLKNNKDTSKQKMQIGINEIVLSDSRFRYHDVTSSETPEKMNFSDLDFKNLNIHVDDFKIKHDTIQMEIQRLGFVDKSGFPVKNLTAGFELHKTFLHFTNTSIKTVSSHLQCDTLYLDFPGFPALKDGGFTNKVDFTINFKNSRLALDDIGYFAPPLKEYANSLHITSKVRGTISNLKLKHTTIYYGQNTRLAGNFELNGLPEFQNTFMFFDIQRMNTTVQDIERINLGDNSLSLPEQLNKIGHIMYRGNFSGFINDFVAYGKLETALGNISTDLSVQPLPKKGISFNGQVQSEHLSIGELVSDESGIGQTSFNLNVRGKNTISNGKNTLDMETTGNIKYFEFRNYRIQQINVNGILSNNNYNGELTVDDENMQLDFKGNVDFSTDTNAYAFTLDIGHINFNELQLAQQYKGLIASMQVSSDISGNTLNTLNGNVKVSDIEFIKSEDQYLSIPNLELQAYNAADSNYLGLNSDVADIYLHGQYSFDLINKSVLDFIGNYAPSFNRKEQSMNNKFQGNFKFKADIKSTREITGFFLPDLIITENTLAKAGYTSSKNNFESFVSSDLIKYKDYEWKNFYIYTTSNDSVLTFESGSKYLQLAKNIKLENFTLLSEVKDNKLDNVIRWHNWDTVVNRGKLDTKVTFAFNEKTEKANYDIKINPSFIVIHDNEWEIEPSRIKIDTGYLHVNDFTLANKNQKLYINGTYNKNTNDSIVISCTDYKLENVNLLTDSRKIHLGGNVNGQATITRRNDMPMFISNITVDSLNLNHSELGRLKLFTMWNEKSKALNVNTELYRGTLKRMGISGQYYPNSEEQLSLNVYLNKLRLYPARPFVDEFASKLTGLCSGDLTVSGSIKEPNINGKLEFVKTSMIINYLGARYNFSDQIAIENNQIQMENITLYDQHGNKGILDAQVNHTYFKDFNLDFSIQADNLMALNTTSTSGEEFYGTAFASGLIEIAGPVDKLNISISASTGPKTQVFIPLDRSEQINEYDFITFTSPSSKNQSTEPTSKPQNPGKKNLDLSFNLNVTPDAEIQIIFDSKIGDIIKARGEGNINMDINTQGKFNMFGEYRITEGDYLFTLKNIINKKFSIREGSMIYWSGDPTNATLDLKAVYSTKTSVEPLLIDQYSGENTPVTSSKTQVDCIISLTGKLTSPEIVTDIEFPKVNSADRATLQGQLNSQEEVNKQFLALMAINSFVPDESERIGAVSKASSVATTTELLSNQLSHWLSQFSNQFDIGVNYRQANELNQQDWEEVELNVSTQLWQDRVNINVGGNYISEQQYASSANDKNPNKIVGDFDMDVKLTKSGRVRFKAFNHYNEEYNTTNPSNYTQGIGFLYQQDFNTLGELLRFDWLNNNQDTIQ